MKYIKNIPQVDKKISNELLTDGWKKLKEPNNLRKAMLLSLPFMIINGSIFIVIILYLYSPLKEILNYIDNGFPFSFNLLHIVSFYLFMVSHEFLHALFIPNVFKSKKIFWGIKPLYAFVYTTEKIKKSIFIIISIIPLLLLSIILPFILNILGWLNWFTILLCLINAMGSSVDCLNIFLVATQVPKGGYVVSNGYETYYK